MAFIETGAAIAVAAAKTVAIPCVSSLLILCICCCASFFFSRIFLPSVAEYMALCGFFFVLRVYFFVFFFIPVIVVAWHFDFYLNKHGASF